jgi:hypothetical protein
MKIIATTTNLPYTAACGELIGLLRSSGEDISPAAERDPAAKNLGLPGLARCLGPSGEPLNMEARRPRPSPSSTEGGALYDEHRDSLRRPSCATAVRRWHRNRRRGNSDRGRRCSSRPRDNTGRHRQGVGRTPTHDRRSRHRSGRYQGVWETSIWARSTVSEPGMVELRDASDASRVVVGVPRRIVFHNGRRVLADAELDDDPSSDQCRPCRERYSHDAAR